MEQCDERSASPGSSSDKGPEGEERGSRRKHRRGRHRRKWKPYSRMSAEEKREHAAREAARAARREAEQKGKPTAPWNTTQFIMEDHGCAKLQIPSPRVNRTFSIESSFSEEDCYESPEEELMEHGLFLEQDFESAYQEMQQERLQRMSKQELVQHCIELGQEVAVSQDRVRNECNARISELEEVVTTLQGDIRRLQGEATPTAAASPPQVACPASS